MDFTSQEVLLHKQRLPTNLSEFIERFNQENNAYYKVVDLNHFVERYLLEFCEMEEKSERALFFEFISKVPDLFDDVSRYVKNTGNERFEQETKLQCYNFIMDAMKQSVISTKFVSEILMVLQPSLILLFKGYSHCKECESIYGDTLQQFQSTLAALFNKMQEFQEATLLKFPKLLDCKVPFGQLHLLGPVVYDLNKLCELVFSLDSSSGMNLYKTLIILIETYEKNIDLKIDVILTGLFSEVKSIGDEFKSEIQNSRQIPVDESRMFLFKLNVVKKILKIFPSFVEGNLQSTFHFVLHLYELLINCCHKLLEENDVNCLKNILVENMNPMLSLFYSEKSFLTYVLLMGHKEISTDLQTAHLLLKLSAVNFLLSSSDKSQLPERKDIIQNIFLMLGENTPSNDMHLVSIRLPLSLCGMSKRLLAFHQPQSGSDPELVTLFYHAYLLLCEYSKGITVSDLQTLESCMADILLRNSSISAAILISDIWIYRLRCGSTENLFDRCLSFSKRLSDLPSTSISKLLLKRMIKFLPLNLKKKLFEQDESLKAFFSNQNEILHRYGAPQLNKNYTMNEKIVSKNISALVDELKEQSCTEELLVKKACCILELCAISISELEILEFLRFTEFATLMFKSEVYEIQIAVLTFLRALNFKKFNDKDPLFAKVRSSLAVLYYEALRSKNYIVRLEALSIFTIMAQLTDIRITQETIAKFPELFPAVKAHVSEVPESGFITSKDKSELLEKQISRFSNQTAQSCSLSACSKSLLSLLKPS